MLPSADLEFNVCIQHLFELVESTANFLSQVRILPCALVGATFPLCISSSYVTPHVDIYTSASMAVGQRTDACQGNNRLHELHHTCVESYMATCRFLLI